MTDEITQNDCQGEACSLCGGKGFRREDEGNNFQICECAEIWPNETEAHANGFEMGYRAHTEVAAAEIASLREQLTEAREIIGKLTEKWEKYRHLFDGISDDEAPRHEIEILDVDLATLRRALAFLKGETDNG